MRALKNDDGFSLVEATAALGISVILFVMLASALLASTSSAHNSRTRQEATALGTQYVELARDLTWDELAMDAAESGDPRVASGDLLASAADIPTNEALVIDGSGLIDGKFTEVVDNTTFTVWQYVTLINGELKRVVVFIDWEANGGTRSHHTSTVIAENRKWSEE